MKEETKPLTSDVQRILNTLYELKGIITKHYIHSFEQNMDFAAMRDKKFIESIDEVVKHHVRHFEIIEK